MSNYFRYENQPCPICGQSFQSNDDIVVCPVCGTPHHRDCYKKNGECGNFDKHNDGFRWVPTVEEAPVNEPEFTPPPQQQQPFNPPFNAQSNFFPNVTNPLSLFPKDMEEDIATEEVATFVNASEHKYLQNFFYAKSGKKTFNWAAFFFTPYWFFYRKMYKLGAIFLAITLLVSAGFSLIPSVQKFYADMTEWTEEAYNLESGDNLSQDELLEAYAESYSFVFENPTGAALVLAQSGLSLAIQIFIGFNANKWYYDHSIKTIRKIKAEEADPQRQRLLFFKSGGISMGAAFLAVLVNNMVVMAFEMLLTFIK